MIPLRHPAERRTLVITLLITALLVIFLSPFTVGGILLLLALGLGLNVFRIWRSRRKLARGGTPVQRQPQLAALVERCRQRLGLDEPVDVYVLDQPVRNAFAIGMGTPYAVVLYTGLIRELGRRELEFVIGHELGHVMFRHTRILGIIGQLGVQTFGIPVLGYAIRYIFLIWSRVAEHSADRAGLAACGSLEAALRTQLKLALGPAEAARADLRGIIQHWTEHDVGMGDLLADFARTHPGLEARMDKLVDFANEQGLGR